MNMNEILAAIEEIVVRIQILERRIAALEKKGGIRRL